MRCHVTTDTSLARRSALSKAVLHALWTACLAPAAFAQTGTPTAPQPPPAGPRAQAQTPPASAQAPAPVAQAPAAQGQDATELDAVVVTGIRGAIQSSIERKRNETVVADLLSSEDIGDLPALSIGEAIETITGAATHREKGGASEIAVRGLGPFLGSTTFNGREATNGSGDRSVNFSMFPSELINTVAIYKTQQADFVEGGVAGVIDMQTLKPLNYGKQRFQFEGRGIYQGYDQRLEEENGLGWRGTLTYVDQYKLGGGDLGVSVGVQRGRSNNPEEMFTSSSTWRACRNDIPMTATQSCSGSTAGTPPRPIFEVTPESFATGRTPPGTPFYLIPSSRTFVQFDEKDERESEFVALQWRPNEVWEVNLDYQHSVYQFYEERQQLNLSETDRGLSNIVFDDRGVLQSFSGNTTLESTPLFRDQEEVYEGGGINIAWQATDRLRLAFDYGWSDTFRSRMDREVRLRSNATDINNLAVPGIINGQRVAYTFDATGGDVPGFTINPLFDVNDADNYSAAARIRRTEQVRNDELEAFRFDGSYDLFDTGLIRLQFGARESEHRFFDINQDRRETTLGTSTADRARIRDANLTCRNAQFPQDDFLSDVDGNPISSWATFDALCLYQFLTGVEDEGPNADRRSTGNRDITEDTTALYAMGVFEGALGDTPISGNFGVRHVITDVESVGLRSAFNLITNPDGTVRLQSNGQFESFTFGKQTRKWLPSFNLAADLTDELKLRFGLYRAMSRPDPEDLGAGRTFEVSTGNEGSVQEAISAVRSNGNPALKPLMSWNVDLSAEWYPNPDSILSAALYYKRFQGGFENALVNETFVVNGAAVTVPVVVTQTSDRQSTIKGIELTGAYRFSMLPAPFDGLGVKASYSYADSSFENEDLLLGDQQNAETGQTFPGLISPVNIFGLSEQVFSGSLYYEIGPVELQAIAKYRSDYYQQFVGAASQNRVVRDATVLDFRATYRLNDSLSFSFEGSNLNNEPRVEDMPIPGSVREVHSYGPRYYLGVRYRF